MNNQLRNLDIAALQNLIDRQAIVDCLYRYTRGIDRHDDELMASAYHDDAVDDHGTFVGRSHDMVKWAAKFHDEFSDAHQHFITNIVVDIKGGEAHSESYWLACFRRLDSEVTDINGGRYVDRLVRGKDGIWRIKARVCVYEWGGTAEPGDVNKMRLEFENGSQDSTDISYRRPLSIDRPHTAASLLSEVQ